MVAELREVLPSAAALLGVPGYVDTLGLAARVGDVERVVVVLVDGLGLHLLPLAAPHAPLLAAVLAGERGTLTELAAPFPSTTPTSLVSLGTGATPGEHGVLGFTVNVPGTDRVLTHITWRDDPAPRQWQPLPTVFDRVAAAGLASTVVAPAAFAASGLTDAAYRGADYAGLHEHEDPAGRLRMELDAGPGLYYGYVAAVDTAAHLYGIDSPQWSDAVRQVDAMLTRLTQRLPTDTAVLITADHGGLDVPFQSRIDVGADPRLTAGVRVIAGEPRVRYLHTYEGADADVAATWRDLLGPRADVLLRADAVAHGLFGPVAADHLARIGDVVVICRDDTVVLATDREPPEIARLIGFHGALSALETAVPLICLTA